MTMAPDGKKLFEFDDVTSPEWKHEPLCTPYLCHCLVTEKCPDPDPICDCGHPAWM